MLNTNTVSSLSNPILIKSTLNYFNYDFPAESIVKNVFSLLTLIRFHNICVDVLVKRLCLLRQKEMGCSNPFPIPVEKGEDVFTIRRIHSTG